MAQSRTRIWAITRIGEGRTPQQFGEVFAQVVREEFQDLKVGERFVRAIDWHLKWRASRPSSVIEMVGSKVRIALYEEDQRRDVVIGTFRKKGTPVIPESLSQKSGGAFLELSFHRCYHPDGTAHCTSEYQPAYSFGPYGIKNRKLWVIQHRHPWRTHVGQYGPRNFPKQRDNWGPPIPGGELVCRTPTGKIEARGVYKDGQADGLWIYTDKEEKLQRQRYYNGESERDRAVEALRGQVKDLPLSIELVSERGGLDPITVVLMMEWSMKQANSGAWASSTRSFVRKYCAGPWRAAGRMVGSAERAQLMEDICDSGYLNGNTAWRDSQVGRGMFRMSKDFCLKRVKRMCN